MHISPVTAEAVLSATACDYPKAKSIGLCMIVKNESEVILDCLRSVRPLVDYILVQDTGSTDGTQDLIREYLRGENIRGEVREEPWVDFAHNRSLALAQLRQRRDLDFALVIDADETMVYDDNFDADAFRASLTEDLYYIKIRLGSIEYYRPQLFRNDLAFKYRGVIHEFVEGPPEGYANGTATGFYTHSGRGGARGKNPRKYEDDAAVLGEVLKKETDPFLISRYTFYLAQSYQDSGAPEKALQSYLERVELGFWDQEIFVSLYHAARLKEQLGYPGPEIIGTYLSAYEVCPNRAESLHGAMRYCRLHGKHHQGYLLGKRAISMACPSTGLFLHSWIYDYGALDEFSILAYWSGHYQDSLEACLRLLRENKLPHQDRARVDKNAAFARTKLADVA